MHISLKTHTTTISRCFIQAVFFFLLLFGKWLGVVWNKKKGGKLVRVRGVGENSTNFLGAYHLKEKSGRRDRWIINGKWFSKFTDYRMGFRLPFIFKTFRPLIPLRKRPGTEICKNGKKISDFRFRTEKKRVTSGDSPQIANGISEKSPYHFTSNWNFRIFWLDGKHPFTHFVNTIRSDWDRTNTKQKTNWPRFHAAVQICRNTPTNRRDLGRVWQP